MSTLPDNPLESGGIAVFAEELRAGRIAAKTAVKAYLDRIQALEPKLNAYQYVAYEQAEEAADAIDKLLASGINEFLRPRHATSHPKPEPVESLCAPIMVCFGCV